MTPQPGDRPNVLFIALDDLNEYIGCLGVNPDVQTPHMDRLAREGTAFANACCPSPVCQPSRSALLSGLQPATTGCYLLPDLPEDSPVWEKALPMPLHFRHNGYRTMCVGKVDHGNQADKATQAVRGESMWDENGGFFNGQQMKLRSRHTSCLTHVDGYYNWAFHWGPLDEDQAETLSDRQTASWAADRLARDYEEPFFLAAGFFRPHVPLIAPQEFFELYEKSELWLPPTGPEDMDDMPPIARQIALAAYQDFKLGMHRQITDHDRWRDVVQAYLACVSFADDCVGRVLRALDESPYADNTIVVLWGDNGWALGEHFHWKKWSVWDCGARVPLIIRAPGMSSGGELCEEGVSLLDIYPTLVELCGLPEVPDLEGESLVGLLSGEQKERERPALTSFGPNNHSLRTRKWRYTRYCDGAEELYDYEEDPSEHVNLAGREEHRSVKESLAEWLPEVNVPALTSSPSGRRLELEPGDQVWFQGAQDGYHGCSIKIRARVQAIGDGVIVHHGSWFAGYSLFVRAGYLSMGVMDVQRPLRWDNLEAHVTELRAPEWLPEGRVWVEGQLTEDGNIFLSVEDELVAAASAGGPLSIYPGGLLEVGRYTHTGYPAIGDYEPREDFPGTIEHLTVEFGEA